MHTEVPPNFPWQDSWRASHILTSDGSDRYGEIKAVEGKLWPWWKILDESQCVTWTDPSKPTRGERGSFDSSTWEEARLLCMWATAAPRIEAGVGHVCLFVVSPPPPDCVWQRDFFCFCVFGRMMHFTAFHAVTGKTNGPSAVILQLRISDSYARWKTEEWNTSDRPQEQPDVLMRCPTLTVVWGQQSLWCMKNKRLYSRQDSEKKAPLPLPIPRWSKSLHPFYWETHLNLTFDPTTQI